MGFAGRVVPVVLLFFIALLSSCAENLPRDIPKSYTAPTEHTFAVPYDKAWTGIVAAISEDHRITTLDKESGLIVTDYTTVDKKILTVSATAPFDWPYKVRYAVHLLALSPEKTSVGIQAGLMMEKFALYKEERSVDWFAAYLRQDLFRRICKNLYRKTTQCDGLFPDYYVALGTCPAPRGPVEVDEEMAQPEEKAIAGQARQTPQVSKATGKAVKKAQQALADAGFNPGPVDGKIGVRTRSALMAFQQVKGISDSGELDQATLMALGL